MRDFLQKSDRATGKRDCVRTGKRRGQSGVLSCV